MLGNSANRVPRVHRRPPQREHASPKGAETYRQQTARWLRREGFSVVAVEPERKGRAEAREVVGFRSCCSVLVQSVANHEEFVREMRGGLSKTGGVGLYRFFVCPPGEIKVSELPSGWGLLYATERTIIEVLRPPGNAWPGPGTKVPAWAKFQHKPDPMAERQVLFALCRKMTDGDFLE